MVENATEGITIHTTEWSNGCDNFAYAPQFAICSREKMPVFPTADVTKL